MAALLLVPALLAVVPLASAVPTVSVTTAETELRNGASYAPPGTTAVKVGQILQIEVAGAIAAGTNDCAATLETRIKNISVDARKITGQAGADRIPVVLSTNSSSAFAGRTADVTIATMTPTSGTDGDTRFKVYVTTACFSGNAYVLETDTVHYSSASPPPTTTNSAFIDSIPPQLAAGTPTISGGASVAAVGSTVSIPYTGTETDTLTFRQLTTTPVGGLAAKGISSSAGTDALNPSSTTTLTIGSGSFDAALTLGGWIQDDAGNGINRTWAAFSVDNQIPESANTFASAKVALENFDVGSSITVRDDLKARLAWTHGAGAPADIAGAAVRRDGTTTDVVVTSGLVATDPALARSSTHGWKVRARDDAGNLADPAGVGARAISGYPFVSLTCLDCQGSAKTWNYVAANPPLLPKSIGRLQVTVTDSDLIGYNAQGAGTAPHFPVMAYVRQMSGPHATQYWDTTTNDFTTTVTMYPAAPNPVAVPGQANTWTFTWDNFTTDAFTESASYAIGFAAFDQSGNVFNMTVPVTIDGVTPTITLTTSPSSLVPPSGTSLPVKVTQSGSVKTKFTLSEGLPSVTGESGLVNVSLTLTGPPPSYASRTRADGAAGAPTANCVVGTAGATGLCDETDVICSGGGSCQGAKPGTGTPGATAVIRYDPDDDGTDDGPVELVDEFVTFDAGNGNTPNPGAGFLEEKIPGAPVGRHWVTVAAADKAGNLAVSRVGGTNAFVDVGPRIVTAPAGAAGATPSPFYIDASGHFWSHIWTSYANNTRATFTDSGSTEAACPNAPGTTIRTCQVHEVRLELKSGSTYTNLWTKTLPVSDVAAQDARDGQWYYNYTERMTTGFPAGEFFVRAVAVVKVPKSPGSTASWSFESATADIAVRRVGSLNTIAINWPKTDGQFNVSGAAKQVRFNATVTVPEYKTRIGDTGAYPWMGYSIYNPATDSFLNLANGGTTWIPRAQATEANRADWSREVKAIPSRCAGTQASVCPDPWENTTVSAQKWRDPIYKYNFSLDAGRRNAYEVHLKRGSTTCNWNTAESTSCRHLRHLNNSDFAIPDGRFTWNVTFWSGAAGTTREKLAEASRPFNVESDKATIRVNYDLKRATDGRPVTEIVTVPGSATKWSHKTFNVMAEVSTGYADVVGAPELGLKRLTTFGNQGQWVKASEGMVLQVKDSTTKFSTATGTIGERTWIYNVTVTLPGEADDGRAYQLFLNVTTSLLAAGSTDKGRVSGPTALSGPVSEQAIIIRLDRTPPVATVHMGGTNATGLNPTPGLAPYDSGPAAGHEAVLFGNVTDIGTSAAAESGGRLVKIRIVDLTEQKTWRNDAVGWVSGVSSETWAYTSAHVFTSSGSTYWRFGPTYPDGSTFRSKLTRFNLYRIDVLATDHVGLEGAARSFDVAFDPAKPTIPAFQVRFDNPYYLDASKGTVDTVKSGALLPSGADKPTTVPTVSYRGRGPSANGNGTIVATWTAMDDYCLDRVNLVALAPSGTTVRARIYSNAGNACVTTASSTTSFPAALLEQSGAADATGAYKVWLEAVDRSGKAYNGTARYWYRVIDDAAARLNTVYFTPTTVGPGGVTSVYANVSEDYKMGSVIARLYKQAADGSFDAAKPLATADMSPAQVLTNGTGDWTVRTTSFNVTLTPGAWTALITARDSAGHGAEGAALLIVREGAPPSVEILSPRSTAQYVNGTLRLHARVSSTNMAASGIAVRTGATTAALAPVTGVVAKPFGTGTSVAGYDVFWNGTVPTAAATVIVNVTATDNGGVAEGRSLTLTVDTVPPTVTAKWSASRTVAGKTVVASGARLTFTTNDTASGVANVLCTLDAGAIAPCTAGFTFPATAVDGLHTVHYTVEDRAGNRAPTSSVTVTLDKTPPVVSIVKNEADFVVQVEDAASGVDEANVTVFTSTTASGTDYAPTKLAKSTDSTYRATLGADVLRYYVEALDAAGNRGSKFSPTAPGRFGDLPIDENRAPVLTVEAPANGAVVKAPVPIRWTASDPDGKPVAIDISVKRADGTGSAVATALDATKGSFTWDASTLEDGSYTLTVRASDGEKTTERAVAITLRNHQTVTVVAPPPTVVAPGGAVTFAVTVDPTKTLKSMRAEYVLNGQVESARPLSKTAQGAYVDSYAPTGSGAYTVRVVVEYEGEAAETVNVGTVNVQGSTIAPPKAFWTPQFGALLAVSVLTVALAAFGAFGRWKK